MIRFSVVIPLVEIRNCIAESLSAWATQQLPRDQFELIIVAPPKSDISSSERLLHKHGRVVRVDSSNQSFLYDSGVRAGRGKYALLTEAHCVPAADCLAELDRFLLARPALNGACVNSIPRFDNPFGRMDAITFEEGFREFCRDADWRKVNVHGFAIRRDVYCELGGFRYEYGRFAEMLLAAELRDRGHRLGFAENARVEHYYDGNLDHLIELVDEYIRGESKFRAENTGPDRVGYSFLSEISNPFASPARGFEIAIADALDPCPLRGTPRGFSRWLARWLSRKTADWRMRRAARRATIRARQHCRVGQNDPTRLDSAYREFILAANEWRRLEALAGLESPARALRPIGSEIAIDELSEDAATGLHPFETFRGKAFRWTGDVAAFHLPFPAGEYRINVVTGDLRPRPQAMKLRVWVNGIEVVSQRDRVGNYEFPVSEQCSRQRGQTLVLKIRPFCAEGDERQLGLPVFSFVTIPVTKSAATP